MLTCAKRLQSDPVPQPYSKGLFKRLSVIVERLAILQGHYSHEPRIKITLNTADRIRTDPDRGGLGVNPYRAFTPNDGHDASANSQAFIHDFMDFSLRLK